MCPRLSPKKSWEGFFGGVLGSLAMGVLGAYVVEGNYLVWLGLALVVSLSSVVGDLVESMFKRDAGVKDSGNFIPGHGGMLDRFDALILSAPFAFVYLCVMMFVTQL
jgi:phosphatidate cytidylyltransferase